MTNSTGNTVNNYRYCGEQFDGTTGLYYLRARYMNPNTGTFISMDSYSGSINDPVSLHKYLYANANPVMYSDPSGYESIPSCVTASSCGTILDSQQTPNYSMIFKTLISNFRNSIVQVGLKNIAVFALVVIISYSCTNLSIIYMNTALKISMSAVTKCIKSVVIAKVVNILFASLLQQVLDWVRAKGKTNSDYNNAYAKHYIVPKGLTLAMISQAILLLVGINGITSSLSSPNIVLIKYSTHYALHNNNVLYCTTVNTEICTAYVESYTRGYAEQVASVHLALASLRGLIQIIDRIVP